jgi:Domain of unknown function (DUF4397)
MSVRRMPLTMGAAAALTALVTGCKVTAPQNTALVRYVNAVSNSGPLDFYANNTEDVTGLEFQNATDYFVVDSGPAIAFSIAKLNDSTPLVTTREQLPGAHTFTLMATDSMAGLTPLFIADSNTAPDKSAVKLRFIHAAPSFKFADVYLIGQGQKLVSPTFASFGFEQVSPYQVVPPGSYYFVATAPGDAAAVVAVDTLSLLTDGTVRTVILMDSKNGRLPLATVTIDDVTRGGS